jgi:hypothetical protein
MFTLRCATFVAALLLIFAVSSPVLAADAGEERSCAVTGVVGAAQARYSPGYKDGSREKAAAKGMAVAPVSGTISKEWSDLRQGMVVGDKCEIRTGPESEVRLEASDGAVLMLGENTRVEISVLRAVAKKPTAKGAEPERTINAKFKLFYGILVGNIKKVTRNSYNATFETPTATAAIRGTVIEIEAPKGANTLIRAFDGAISVAPAGSNKFKDVGDGKMVNLAPGQKDFAVTDVPKGYKRKGFLLRGEKPPAPPIEEGSTGGKPQEAMAANFGDDSGDAAEAQGFGEGGAVAEGYDGESGAEDAIPGEQLAQNVPEEPAPSAGAPAPAVSPAPPPMPEDAAEGDGAPVAPVAPVADDADDGRQAIAGKGEERVAADKDKADDGPAPLFSKPDFELSLGMATVGGKPWTRIALGVDLPIWKFGVFLDLELFIDDESKVSNKGWDWSEGNKAEFIYRKIRYIRYGREDEPLFVKFGGLSNVTLGYGMIVDRFTNMLRYPDEKLLGLQFYLNDVTSIGLTVQTLISDFAEMRDDGGIVAARAAVRPLKSSGIFLLDGLSVGAMYALDRNVYAPARKWQKSEADSLWGAIRNEPWAGSFKDIYESTTGKIIDTAKINKENSVRDSVSSFALYGIDVGLPIVKTDFLGVEIYGQSAFRADTVRGWGIGAPGVAVKVWKLFANAEYRKIEGRFIPGYFDTYYLDERYSRGLLEAKGDYIDSVSLQGVYGRVGLDAFGVLKLDVAYQYMFGKDSAQKSQSYEASAGIGETVMSRVPKFNLAEVYVRNANIGIYEKYDKDGNSEDPKKAGRFDRSPGMYWGYRLGFEIAAGATLIWDYRYGWKRENGKLVPDNQMLLQTALRF